MKSYKSFKSRDMMLSEHACSCSCSYSYMYILSRETASWGGLNKRDVWVND